MKRTLFTIIIILAAVQAVFAQSETKSFDVDGIKVIFKPSVKNILNVRIYYRGGNSNFEARNAGIEDLALDAATKCGTKKYSADAIQDSLDKYDILLSGSSTYDYGYVQVNCIPKYFNQAWDLFAESVNSPAFAANEVELLKNKKIAIIKRDLSNPDNSLEAFQLANAFASTPYAFSPLGSEETLSHFTADDLKKYYPKLLNKNRIFIVVVGKTTKEELTDKIIASFGNLPTQPYTRPDNTPPVWNDSKMMTEQHDLSTNYVSAIMNSPGMTNIQYVPFQLGVSGLSGNIGATLRNDLRLSYSQGARSVKLLMPYAEMYVSTTRPLQAMQVMINKLKELQNGEMNDEWLNRIKSGYIISSYIDGQSSADLTNALGEAEVLGDWQYAEHLPQLVMMTTPQQVNQAMQFYIVGLRWYYEGNTEAIQADKVPKY